jgi:protein O-mannosyl-transferase
MSEATGSVQKTEPAFLGELAGIWQRRHRFILAGILIAATLLLYAPVTHYPFINFDDPLYVSQNPHVTSGVTFRNLAWAFHTFETGNWLPMTWVSHMLDCQVFGLNPAGHHYSNVLVHAANVLLLFFLLEWATGERWLSFLVAVLFAFHPLNVENVAWISERKTLLSAFFSLLVFAAYGWHARRPKWSRYMVVVGTFLLAVMAKPMAVTMPLALLLIDYWPLRRVDQLADSEGLSRSRAAVRLFLEKVPLLLISAVISGIAVLAQKSAGGLNTALPPSEHFKNVAIGYLAYLEKAFWPRHLAIFYPLPAHIGWKELALALLVLGSITGLAYRLRQKRYFAAGWLFYLLSLLPVIGIVQVGGQSMADRYAYTPLIGIYVVVVWGAAELCRRLPVSRALTTLVACCLITALAVTTRTTLSYWRSGVTIFSQAEKVAAQPNPEIENDLGLAYSDAGQPDEALKHFKLAKAASHHGSLALGTFLIAHGQLRESIPELQDAVQYADTESVKESALNNLATAYLLLGDYGPAEENYTAALQLNPSRMNSLFGRGQAFYAQGRCADAARDFTRALQLAPNAELSLWLGKSLEGQHKYEEALAAYSNAARDAATAPEAYARIAALRKDLSLSQ